MRALVAAAALLLAALSPLPAQGVDNMPATHAEWDQIHEGLTVPQVRNIIGSPGTEAGHGGGDQRYHIDFALAWRDDKVGRVVFSELTDLSIDKNIVEP